MKGSRFRTSIIVLVVGGVLFSGHAKNFYIASNGNNGNNGLSSGTAWQTIGHLNTSINTLEAGDSVLFRRGDVFSGEITMTQSGSSVAPICFGAYGSGANPVISGALTVSSFSNEGGNMYGAAVQSEVKALHIGDRMGVLARKPNDGFYTIGSGSKTSITDAAHLGGVSNYYRGVNVRLRSKDWTFEARKITSSSNGTVSWADNLYYDATAGWGYYLDNHADFLDASGEWYYNSNQQKAIIYSNNALNGTNVYATIHDYGIKFTDNKSHVVIENIDFKYQAVDGVKLSGTAQNIVIKGCVFSSIQRHGISCGGNFTDLQMFNNSFRDILGTGIICHNINSTKIHNNTFERIGMVQGYGAVFGFPINNNCGIASANGGSNHIHHNVLDNIGYAGIRIDGNNNMVEKNYVRNSMLKLTDGGALYCWGERTSNGTFRNNIVENIPGNFEAKSGEGNIAVGIYLDNKVHGMTIEGNVIINAGSIGMLCNAGTRQNTIRNNVIFEFGGTGLAFPENISDETNIGNTISGNTIAGLADSVICVSKKTNNTTDNYNPGQWSNNIYVNPYSNIIAKSSKTGGTHVHRDLSFEAWKNEVGESSSESHFWGWNLYEVTDTTGSEMITNGTFNSSTANWSAWSNGTKTMSHVQSSQLDGGALKLENTSSNANHIAIAYNVVSGGFEAGQWYQVAFSIVSEQLGNVLVNPKRHFGSYTGFGISRIFPFFTSRTDYRYTLKSPETINPARVDFQISKDDKSYILDNVSVLPVSVQYQNPRDKVKIFYNASDNTKTVDLGTYMHTRIDKSTVCGEIDIAPWSSVILVKQDNQCTNSSVMDGVAGRLPNKNVIAYSSRSNNLLITSDNYLHEITLIDISGRCIKKVNAANKKSLALSLDNVSSGMYLVRLHTISNGVITRTFIRQ